MTKEERAAKKAAKAADARIEKAYYAACNGVPIRMLDVPKIFKMGLAAIAAGADDEALATAVRAYVETIRTDRAAAS